MSADLEQDGGTQRVRVLRPRATMSTRVERGTFATNLRFIMRRRGMSSLELAAILGTNERRVMRIRAAHTFPNHHEIPEFAAALDVPPEWLAWMEPAEFVIATRPK